jgi:hypothetical protein
MNNAFLKTRANYAVFALLALLLMRLPVFGLQNVNLAWTPSSDPTVVGYFVYYGSASGIYTQSISLGNVTSAVISGLQDGTTYFFVVRAYDILGLESVPSNEVSYAVPGCFLSMKNLQLKALPNAFSITTSGTTPASWMLQASRDLRTWNTLTSGTNSPANVAVVVSENPAMFFRMKSTTPGVALSIQNNQPGGFPNSFFVTSTGAALALWTLETAQDLRTWSAVTSGTNSPPNVAVVISSAPALFFRLKGG